MTETARPRLSMLAEVLRSLADQTARMMAGQSQAGEIAEHTARLHTMIVSGVLHGLADAMDHDVPPPDLGSDYISAIAKCNAIMIGMIIMGAGRSPDESPALVKASAEALLEDIKEMTRSALAETTAKGLLP